MGARDDFPESSASVLVAHPAPGYQPVTHRDEVCSPKHSCGANSHPSRVTKGQRGGRPRLWMQQKVGSSSPEWSWMAFYLLHMHQAEAHGATGLGKVPWQNNQNK